VSSNVDARQWFGSTRHDKARRSSAPNEMHIRCTSPCCSHSQQERIHFSLVPEVSGTEGRRARPHEHDEIEADRDGTSWAVRRDCGCARENGLRRDAESKGRTMPTWVRDQQSSLSAANVTEFNQAGQALGLPLGHLDHHPPEQQKRSAPDRTRPHAVGDRDAFAATSTPCARTTSRNGLRRDGRSLPVRSGAGCRRSRRRDDDIAGATSSQVCWRYATVPKRTECA